MVDVCDVECVFIFLSSPPCWYLRRRTSYPKVALLKLFTIFVRRASYWYYYYMNLSLHDDGFLIYKKEEEEKKFLMFMLPISNLEYNEK